MPDPLLTALEFKRQVLTDLLIVSTLLAGIAMSGMLFLLSDKQRSTLRTALVVSMTAAMLLFLLGTIVDVIILPGMRRAAEVNHPAQIRGFIILSRFVVYTLLTGTAILTASIGALGYLHSRWAGRCTAAAAAITALLFAGCAVYLNAVMYR